MSNENGVHASSSTIPANDIAKRVANTRASNDSIPTKSSKFKSKNILLITVNESRTMKELKKKRLLHNDSNNNTNNRSGKKLKEHSHTTLDLIPSTSSNEVETDHSHHQMSNTYCDACGQCYGEMISCDTCPATFHLLCATPPLSKEDLPKGSYFCEHCRTITKTPDEQQKVILPFSFDPKKNLGLNGGSRRNQSTLGQIKLPPTVSNGRSLIQASREIKFRPTKNKQLSSSASNLKRKRQNSSSSPSTNSSTSNSVQIAHPQLETLHQLFLSCKSEDFPGPSFSSNASPSHRDHPIKNHSTSISKHCFICRKSSLKQGPSIHCDYCPLTYHLDCLTPPMTSLPISKTKWMCPNHTQPILDRYLLKKNHFPVNERIKMYNQSSSTEQNTFIQDFSPRTQTSAYSFSDTTNNHRLECVNISQIPKAIEEFYSRSTAEQKEITEPEEEEQQQQQIIPTTLSFVESSSVYDPVVWDTLQAILNHITNNEPYEFSIQTNQIKESPMQQECDNLSTIDTLLQALNEPNNGRFDEEKPIPTSFTNSFSLLIDLSQFRSSHAALIHLHSQTAIYIRKHVIWFGSSSLNDICLNHFTHSSPCQYITERHACLYYDRKRNLFELLNYSEYGTIVNDLRYGLGMIADDPYKQENEGPCSCSTKALCQPDWDGAAQIDQGTVIKMGCHEFVFYRHIVR